MNSLDSSQAQDPLAVWGSGIINSTYRIVDINYPTFCIALKVSNIQIKKKNIANCLNSGCQFTMLFMLRHLISSNAKF